MSGFNVTKGAGDAGEFAIAVSLLAAHHGVHWLSEGARYDLVVDMPHRHLLEVKNEQKFAASGNLCVELQQGNPWRESGLLSSDSTVYIHYFGDRCVLYRTRSMVLHLARNKDRYRTRQFTGADNFNAGVIVPIKDLLLIPWADEIETNRIAKSKVLSASNELRMTA